MPGLSLLNSGVFFRTSWCCFSSGRPEHLSVAFSASLPIRSVASFSRTKPVWLDFQVNFSLSTLNTLYKLSAPNLHLSETWDIWTTHWSHLQPWPLSGTIPHPAPPRRHLFHQPLRPLLPLYLPWLRICPFQQCAGQWRMERERQRKRPTAARLQQTHSAGWWVCLGWDTGSLFLSCWRWERGDWVTDAWWKKVGMQGWSGLD